MELDGIFEVILDRHRAKLNDSNATGEDVFFYRFIEKHPAISIFFLVCIALTTLVGFIGNILVIGGVCVYRRLRTTGNVFIVNLALADLFVITVVQPFNVIGIVIGPEFFREFEGLCHVVATVCVCSCACSMMNLAAIALNRYIFVCKNKIYRRIYNKWTTPLICIGLWIIVVLIDLPNYLGWGAHTFDYKSMGCSFDRVSSLSYTLFLSAVIYWVPFFLVFSCYILIYRYVQKNRKELRKAFSRISCNNNTILNARREEDIRMVRTFFIVVVVFLICWTPYDLLILFDQSDSAHKNIYVILLALGHANSSLNSILYAATNKRFRRGYLEFICFFNRCFPRKEVDRKDKRFQQFLQSDLSNSVSSLNTIHTKLSQSNTKLNSSRLALNQTTKR